MKVQEHYWWNEGGMVYPKTRPGDPPWGKVYKEKWTEVSKEEFLKRQKSWLTPKKKEGK